MERYQFWGYVETCYSTFDFVLSSLVNRTSVMYNAIVAYDVVQFKRGISDISLRYSLSNLLFLICV